jgi:hypothetical protein
MTNEVAPVTIREKIGMLEAEMLKLPQVHIPVKHYFAEGIYAREILIPKGTLLTGRIHRHESISLASMGKISVIDTRSEGEAKMVTAPYAVVSPAGSKKAAIAIEDTIWTTLHANPTNETDIETLEGMLYFDTPEDIERFRNDRHREDFRQMLIEYGLTYEIVRAISEITEDRIQITLADHGIKVAPSPIEGAGIFARGNISAGSTIAPARINGMRTQVGRFTNHSSKPNAIMVLRENNDADLVATREIREEEITIDYRESLKLAGITPIIKEGKSCLECIVRLP